MDNDDDFNYEAHERLRERAANKSDSVLHSFKAHFEAADWYRKFSNCASWVTTAIAGILTVALIWRLLPNFALVLLAIAAAAISGYKTAAKPQEKAYDHYKAGDAYHKLFIDFLDFVHLELADKELGLDSMEARFGELSERYSELNEEMPNLTRRWYDRLDEEQIREEVATNPEMKEFLTGVAKLGYDDKKD